MSSRYALSPTHAASRPSGRLTARRVCGVRVGRGDVLGPRPSEPSARVLAVYGVGFFPLAHPWFSRSVSIASAIGANSSYGHCLTRITGTSWVRTVSSCALSSGDPLRHAIYRAYARAHNSHGDENSIGS